MKIDEFIRQPEWMMRLICILCMGVIFGRHCKFNFIRQNKMIEIEETPRIGNRPNFQLYPNYSKSIDIL